DAGRFRRGRALPLGRARFDGRGNARVHRGRRVNLTDIVRLNARHRGEREAILFEDERITYAELWEGIECVAAALAAAGIGKGDRVAVLARNSPQYVELYFAVAKIGAMLVPLSFWQRSPELAYVLGDAEPALVLAEPEFLERL